MSRPAARAADEHDPHLRLPKALRTARMAEAAFIVVTTYVALSLPLGLSDAGRMVRARLALEALVALVVLLALPRQPRPARVAAIVLSVYVLLGCVPFLLRAFPAILAAPSAFPLLSLLLTTAACAAQAVVLAACLSARPSSGGAGS